MKKLKFPAIKELNIEKKSLSMDDYLDFVNFNLRHTVERKANWNWKKLLVVNAAFYLK